jgi:hypothetical protein
MPKAAKIAIIVVGLVVGLGMIGWRFLSAEDAPGPSRLQLVDVLSGEAMTLRTGNSRIAQLPGTGKSGEKSLYPIVLQGDRWVIAPLYRDVLIQRFGDDDRVAIDLETFTVPNAP